MKPIISLITLVLIFSSIGAINAAPTIVYLRSEGTSHYFTIDIELGNGGTYHFERDVKCRSRSEVIYENNDEPARVTVNSKAWRDFGWCNYRWETTGTTKSIVYKGDLKAETDGDTLFNGGHLSIKPIFKYKTNI